MQIARGETYHGRDEPPCVYHGVLLEFQTKAKKRMQTMHRRAAEYKETAAIPVVKKFGNKISNRPSF